MTDKQEQRWREAEAEWVERYERLEAENERLRAALRQILEDPDAKILDSHRDDGWEACIGLVDLTALSVSTMSQRGRADGRTRAAPRSGEQAAA